MGPTPDTVSQVTPVSTSMPSYSIAATQELEKNITNSIGMEFVLIPAGEFEMGSPSSEKYRVFNEGPVHNVKLAYDFYLGKYEVTQKQWREILGNSPSFFKGDELPVEQVSWYDIQEFIKKLNEKEGTDKYRLPSEAEWEYAARAGTTFAYSFGDNVSELRNYAWYRRNSNGSTHPVGQKNPNPWGLYDMNGNVWEFTEDSWHDTYNAAPTDGSPWESKDAQLKVSRGGAWRPDAEELRSAMRLNEAPYGRYPGLGFRLARSVRTLPKNTSASLSPEKQDFLSLRFNLQNYTALQLWQPPLPSTMSIVVGQDGKIYVLKRDNTVSVVDPVSGFVTQMTGFDAATREIMHGFASNEATNELTERVASPDGMLYFTDWSKGIIVREEETGARKIVAEGLTKNSPIQFDFGPDGMLYFLSECNFRKVNATGGPVKSFDFMKPLNSELLCPMDFAFEPSGDVLFISPTSSNIIRATLHEEKLEVVVKGTLNSPAMAISPEGRIFIGQTAEFPIEPSRITRLDDDGKTSAIADVPGLLSAIAFGPDGTLYGTSIDVSPDHNEFWLYQVLNNGTLQMIMHRTSTLNQQTYKLHSLSVDTVSGDIVGFDDLKKRVVRFSSDGKQESVIGPVMPYPVWSGRAVVDSEGAVWLLPVAEGRLSADRELYRILPDGESKLIARLPYIRGCCGPDTMAIGPDNAAYLILSPEFELKRVSREGRIEELAKNLPINPLGIAVNRTGSIIFSSSEGIFALKPKE